MSLVQFNPWSDAASYGQGLGSTLGQILLQMPQIRAAAAQKQAMFQNEQSEWPLQHQLLQAQVANAQAQPDLQRQRLTMQQLLQQRELQSKDINDKLHTAQTDKLTNAGGVVQSKPLTFDQNESADKLTGSMIADKKVSLMNGQPTAPINLDPQTFTAIRDAIVGALKNGQSGAAAGSQMMQGAMLQPNVVTNQVPTPVPSTGLGGFMGMGTPTRTNMVPQIRTNSYDMRLQAPQMQQQSSSGMKQITPDIAVQFLQQAKGDKNVARQLATQAGFTF